MKISEQWLRQWVNPANTSEQLAEQLTMAGLEIDDRLEHLGRRRIGRGLGAAGFAVHRRHFGKRLDDPVLRLQDLGRLGHGQARQRRRHVHQRAFIQARHELRP